MVKIYQPWPAPVQAACFQDGAMLPEIDRWVAGLRAGGHVPADVDFTVRRHGGVLHGVLRDRSGEHELRPGSFLVFGPGGLRVLDERSFLRQYRDCAS